MLVMALKIYILKGLDFRARLNKDRCLSLPFFAFSSALPFLYVQIKCAFRPPHIFNILNQTARPWGQLNSIGDFAAPPPIGSVELTIYACRWLLANAIRPCSHWEGSNAPH